MNEESTPDGLAEKAAAPQANKSDSIISGEQEKGIVDTAKRSVAELYPDATNALKVWGDFVRGKPSAQKLIGFGILIILVIAGAGYFFHSWAIGKVQDEDEATLRVRDGTIAAQQNTMTTNANTIEGLRSDLQSVTRENTSLQRRYEEVRQERDAAKTQLAPFLAAGNQYYSNVPTAERLESLLSALTNSAADVKALREYQSRKADLSVAIVGEGAGWLSGSGPLTPNCIVYLPLFGGASNAGFHFILKNSGELPAEVVQLHFSCSTQQVVTATAGWEDQTSLGLPSGQCKYLVKTDAVYPGFTFAFTALRFLNKLRTTSSKVNLTIAARNSPQVDLDFELFLFPAWTNVPPFVSTNRLAWKEFEAIDHKN